jgi:hypothetical protein
MAFKGDDSTFSLATTVTLALAVAAMVFVKEPLKSSRPLGSGAGLHGTAGELKVRARLWEDPFEAVEKGLEAQKQIAVQVVADGMKLGVVTARVAQQPQGDDGLESLHSRIKKTDRESILALVVMTQGESSVEAGEARIRDRYAVGAALEVGCFSPDKGESLSYFIWDYPPLVQAKSGGASSRDKPLSSTQADYGPSRQYTPYEWYSRSALGPCADQSDTSDKSRNVLVLWVKAQEGEDRILARINVLISKLEPNPPKFKNERPKLPFQVKLIGPRTSSEFRSLLKEIDKHLVAERGTKYSWESGKGLQMYSPWATVMPGLLSYGLKDNNDQRGKDCRSYAECTEVFEQLLDDAGLVLSYGVTNDEVLFESLLKELERRQVRIGTDRIVLIGEWDSFYARALPFSFAAGIYQHRQGPQKSEHRLVDAASRPGRPNLKEKACRWVGGEIDLPLEGSVLPAVSNILHYSYLSGLDGETSEGQAKRSKTRKEETSKDTIEDKERFRDIDAYERPEGPSQLDYLRRLVTRIKGEQSERVKAIGILGRDTYDALLILQAVREQFPNALFFTTDLDARYFHQDEQKWTRNLIVAAQFGLQLHPSLQQAIPPFRSSLQTSAFFAVLQAIDRVTCQSSQQGLGFLISNHGIKDAYATEIPPRLFEIGRHGAVDLSADIPSKGWKTIHPTRVDVADDSKSLKLPSNIGLLWIVGLLLGFLVLWGYGRLWNWLAAWNEPDPTKHPFLWGLRRAWVFIPVIAALWFWCLVVHFTYVEDEPFSWSDGVSVWPTELLRLFATVLSVSFLIKACADLAVNTEELTEKFFPQEVLAGVGEGRRRNLEGFWTNVGWMFHGSKQEHPGEASRLWDRYCRAHTWPQRTVRIALWLLLYLMMVLPVWRFMNDGEWRLYVPCRGEISCGADTVLTSLSVFSVIILNLAVLDAVILCTKWVQEMAATTGLNPMEKVRLIIDRTRVVNRRILYPFLSLFLLIGARSHYFDSWDFPPVLILVLTVNSLVALASACMLYLAAVGTKRKVLAPLQLQLDRALTQQECAEPGVDSGPSSDHLRQIISEIDAVQQGAFVPFYRQPVVQATLVAVLAFLQYWYLGQ